MNNGYEPNEGQDVTDDETDLQDAAGAGEEETGAEDTGAGKTGAGFDAEKAIIAAAQEEITALNDKILRLAAELENTRRRGEREKADAGRYAIATFARDLLAVADNFERALEHAPTGDAAKETGVAGLIAGVEMTERELNKTLERHGVVRIDPVGDKFDPNLHQAVAQAPAAGVPSGHVAQTAQTGFVLGERILRAAMVVVSTGEPAASEAQDSGSDEPGADKTGTHVDTKA